MRKIHLAIVNVQTNCQKKIYLGTLTEDLKYGP